MPDPAQTDLFEDDGVTPKKAAEKPAITDGELKAIERAARAEGEASALKTVVAAKPAESAPPADKTFTRAQLRASVAAGDITEDQMDDILEAQLEKKLTAKLEGKTVSTVAAADQARSIQAKIDGYVDVHPDLVVDGSDLRKRVQVEFNELVAIGDDPKNVATQLKAIRAAVGPLKQQGRRPKPESFDDTGGAGGNDDRDDSGGVWKGIPARNKAYYQKLISKGIYKGESDKTLAKELNAIRARRKMN